MIPVLLFKGPIVQSICSDLFNDPSKQTGKGHHTTNNNPKQKEKQRSIKEAVATVLLTKLT